MDEDIKLLDIARFSEIFISKADMCQEHATSFHWKLTICIGISVPLWINKSTYLLKTIKLTRQYIIG